MYPSCALPWLVCICFLWELWSGSPGSHVPVMRSPFIPLPCLLPPAPVPGCQVGACGPGLCYLGRQLPPCL